MVGELLHSYNEIEAYKSNTKDGAGFYCGLKRITIKDIPIILNIKKLQTDKQKICNQEITDVLTVNGVRFTLTDGSWGLVRASSNKPSLVVVTESPVSDKIKTDIFRFIDDLLQKTGKIGEYDQKI